MAEAAEIAREAASVLQDREDHLSQETEDMARGWLPGHQSAQRLVEDSRKHWPGPRAEEKRLAPPWTEAREPR